MPLISIVIAVYNNERYIENAVRSVENQGTDDYEIIIVDDGSTDKTSIIVDELSDKNSRIKVIHQDNQWIYASFNRGIREAGGEYIYILNSDDKLASGALEIMISLIKKYDHPDVIWTKCAVCKCDSNQNILNKKDMNGKVKDEIYCRKGDEPFSELLIADQMGLMGNQANLYKSDIAKKVQFRNDVYGADRLYNLALAKYINSFVICKQEIYLFFEYPRGTGNSSIGKYYGYEQYMFNEFYIHYKEMLAQMSLMTEDNISVGRKRRRRNFTKQMEFLLFNCTSKTIDEKLKMIFEDFIDDVIIECSVDFGIEEIEARVFSMLRSFFTRGNIPEDTSEMYFVFEMLESLLRYEKDDEDMEKIRRGVYHPLNPHHLGMSFYKLFS